MLVLVAGELDLGVDAGDHFDDGRLLATHDVRQLGCNVKNTHR